MSFLPRPIWRDIRLEEGEFLKHIMVTVSCFRITIDFIAFLH